MTLEELNAEIRKTNVVKDGVIEGGLDLESFTSIPEGFNPTVGGNLYLGSLTSIPEGFNPTVGGSLYLGSLTSIPEGFNPTVSGSLFLESLTSIPEGFNPTVSGSLFLESLTSIPEGFNPTVSRSLFLESLTSIPEGFNPTMGRSLYLRLLTSIPEGFNPTVGGNLYLGSLTSIPEGFNTNAKYIYAQNIDQQWNDIRLLSVDGEVMKVFSERKIGEASILRCESWGGNKCFVARVGEYYAHGETVRHAVEDANFKHLQATANVDDIVKQVKSTQRVTREQYRLLTGACRLGMEQFLASYGLAEEESLPLTKCCELVRNAYGGERFCEFFA